MTARRLTPLLKSSLMVLPCLKNTNQPLSGLATAPQHAQHKVTGSVPEVVVYNNPQGAQILVIGAEFKANGYKSSPVGYTSYPPSSLACRNNQPASLTGLQEALLRHAADVVSLSCPYGILLNLAHAKPKSTQQAPVQLLPAHASRTLLAAHHIRMKGAIRFLLPHHSCMHPAGIDTDRISKYLFALTFHHHFRSPACTTKPDPLTN
ncbi:hypothetical protein BDR05DRAFT_1000866 [Suillus weaverae]|nr:hypothetical protein BDR05DRAFT_1000866 [Suillus weaverae]